MICFVYGGSASGKSEYAEQLAQRFGKETADDGGEKDRRDGLLYVATMKDDSEEASLRIRRHRMQRGGRGFSLHEAYTLSELEKAPASHTILFDCISNFTANVMFSEEFLSGICEDEAFMDKLADEIWMQIKKLWNKCTNLVIVGDVFFSDGVSYDEMTERYIQLTGMLFQRITSAADAVIEVVYGIPARVK